MARATVIAPYSCRACYVILPYGGAKCLPPGRSACHDQQPGCGLTTYYRLTPFNASTTLNRSPRL